MYRKKIFLLSTLIIGTSAFGAGSEFFKALSKENSKITSAIQSTCHNRYNKTCSESQLQKLAIYALDKGIRSINEETAMEGQSSDVTNFKDNKFNNMKKSALEEISQYTQHEARDKIQSIDPKNTKFGEEKHRIQEAAQKIFEKRKECFEKNFELVKKEKKIIEDAVRECIENTSF